MKSVKAAIAALALLAGASVQAQQDFSIDQIKAMLAPYATPEIVTLPNGREVAFTCMGQGSPTVILIPGLGDFAGLSWGTVQPQMAETTRVCAWDRPGWGLSDGWEGTHTVETTTATLEGSLATGRIPGPYVLVGHSLGGYESLLYADRHPDQVVGMVLVDSSIPDQTARQAALGLPAPDIESGPVAAFRTCAAAIREGRSKLGGPDPDNCVTYPPFFPDELARVLGEKVGNPAQYETMASFIASVTVHSTLVLNPARNYGDMPLAVLTATVDQPLPPETTPERRAAMEAWNVEWDRGHDELAALSSRGVNMRVPGANHYIQRTKPQAVVDAVAAVVAEARAADK